MNRAATILIALLGVAVGAFVLYPEVAQYYLFTAIFRANVLVLKYWHAHPTTNPSLESVALAQLLRLQDPLTPDYQLTRKRLDSFGAINPVGAGVVQQQNITHDNKGSLTVYWYTPPVHDNKTILFYLHGGAFISGSFKSHMGSVAELARRAEVKVFFVEYRLAPEHPFPAMVDDAINAYKWLIHDQKIAANRIVFAGDSAGGGLVLLTLLALQDEDKGTIRAPSAAVTFSAWTDLSLDRPSIEANKDTDALVKEAFLTQAAALATNTRPEDSASRKSHKFSPIFAPADKLGRLPPLYMSVGGAEVLYDDTVHFAGKATQAGADIKLVAAPHMQHVFCYFYDFVPEADQELTHVANWIKKQQKQRR